MTGTRTIKNTIRIELLYSQTSTNRYLPLDVKNHQTIFPNLKAHVHHCDPRRRRETRMRGGHMTGSWRETNFC